VKPLATGLTLAAALILSAAAGATPEQPAMTAGDLAQLCSGTDHVSVNACRIYMLGVTQGIAVGIRIAGSGKAASRPCVPPGIAAEDLEAALKSRLAALDSAGQQRDAAGFIGAALAAKFPCGADKS
jgi:hypothetical protein